MKILPHSRGGALWRFLLAAVIIISGTAATTAVAGLLQFKQLAADISLTPALKHAQVTIPNPGEPQTILIIGSDHRAADKSFQSANTDTMMLIRLNGASQTINVMSIPRDLQVRIPGGGQVKLNAAYSIGGPNLLIKTIRANVFPALHVNHIIDVNFGSFEKLVNAIGCVYSDVDHRYYNNTALTNYSSINIQPGYQKLCGANALAFVRFRHTDSDLVRNARQQDFIRWAKDQYGVNNIINNKDRLLRIFGSNTQTDGNLHTTDGLINLFNLVAFSAGHAIKQIKFPAYELPGCGAVGVSGLTTPCYLSATSSAEGAVFRVFMRPTTQAAATRAKSPGKSVRNHTARIQTAGLSADGVDGRAQAAALSRVGMPVYFPRLIDAGSNYCSDQTSLCPLEVPSPGSYPRHYLLRDQRGHPYPAYRMTLELNPVLGEYYGVQGTTWLHPPLLDHPSETKVVAGKKLLLFAQAGNLIDVAWRTRHAVYWISNTLTGDIPNRKMVDIAASLVR
jgi:polyisoprenyl-teichoic acid--peptidoglycan teichoic acid transferase